ncbi:hypothetical protein, partial [Enterobacter kobei]|uniref:hypothetical protein n=1 Tax=Enterobacter kobei TaxID=208224 RepID=UPI003EE25C5F
MSVAKRRHIHAQQLEFGAHIRAGEGFILPCQRGGICIDDGCKTSDRDVFAIGECALWEGKIFGLVAPGYQMAR